MIQKNNFLIGVAVAILLGFSYAQARVVIKVDDAKLITPPALFFASSTEQDVSAQLRKSCDDRVACGVMPKYSFTR